MYFCITFIFSKYLLFVILIFLGVADFFSPIVFNHSNLIFLNISQHKEQLCNQANLDYVENNSAFFINNTDYVLTPNTSSVFFACADNKHGG